MDLISSIKLRWHKTVLWYRKHKLHRAKQKHETKLKNKETEIANRIENLKTRENKEISNVSKHYAEELTKTLQRELNKIKTDFFSDIIPLKNKFDEDNKKVEYLKAELKRNQYRIGEIIDEIRDTRESIIETKRGIHDLKENLSDSSDDFSHGKRGRYLNMRDINEEIQASESSLIDLEEEENNLTNELEDLKSEQPELENELRMLEPIRNMALREYENTLKQREREWSYKESQIHGKLKAQYAPKYNSERDAKIAGIQLRYDELIYNVPSQVQMEIDKLKNNFDRNTKLVKESEQVIKKMEG